MFHQYEQFPSFDQKIHLAPDVREIAMAYTYFVDIRDSDGRNLHGPSILQWQPGIKAWCRYGFIATGVGGQLEKTNARIICRVPFPDLENTDDFLSGMVRIGYGIQRKIRDKKPFTDEDLENIRQMALMISGPLW